MDDKIMWIILALAVITWAIALVMAIKNWNGWPTDDDPVLPVPGDGFYYGSDHGITGCETVILKRRPKAQRERFQDAGDLGGKAESKRQAIFRQARNA